MAASVLVPLDGSGLSEQALPFAVSLVQQLEGVILLVRVLPPMPLRYTASGMRQSQLLMQEVEREARRYLEQRARRLVEIGVPVVTQLVEGDPAESIIELSETYPTSHIVMGTHGRSGLSRWAMGSVTNRLLRSTRHPLLIIRPREARPVDLVNLPRFKQIVVPLDGSSRAEAILSQAKRLAHACQGNILLFQAIPPTLFELGGNRTTSLEARLHKTLCDEAERYLKGIAERIMAEGITASHHITTGSPADEILAYAAQVDASLIAMTTHAREGVSRLILGSVADRVVRAGQVPVLVTRP